MPAIFQTIFFHAYWEFFYMLVNIAMQFVFILQTGDENLYETMIG